MAMLCIRVAQSSVMFTGNTRLPMVAGWDRLLPEWFTRLDERRKTPVNSILFVGAMTLAFGLLGMIGVGQQEAFQLLWNASGVFYALTYLVMFAIPLWGLRRTGQRMPLWVRAAAGSGFLMTLLYVALSVFPIVKVESQVAFAAKITTVIVAANVIGAAIFIVAERKRNAHRAKTAATAK